MQLHQRNDELLQRNVDVLIVTFEPTDRARIYHEQMKLPWPILCDQRRTLYSAYGMESGSWWNVYGWPSWWVYFKLFAKGRRLQKPHGDFRQLGGDVLIDPDATIRLHHIGSGPADRPEIGRLIDCTGEGSKGPR